MVEYQLPKLDVAGSIPVARFLLTNVGHGLLLCGVAPLRSTRNTDKKIFVYI